VNLRPARSLPGLPCLLRNVDEFDIVLVRENTEGEYSGAGGRVHRRRREEVAVETSVFTRVGTERIIRYAFEYARGRGRRRVTSATKSNALRHAMPFWDEVMDEVSADFPDVEHDSVLIDALAARVITAPDSLDVVVASNLFGDALSDLTAAVAGSLGTGPSANLDPTPACFRPYAQAIERAVDASTADPQTRTRDLGGTAATREAGEAIRRHLGRVGRGRGPPGGDQSNTSSGRRQVTSAFGTFTASATRRSPATLAST
jgi:tartrate dehydrogenase/decarboxylase/D-malate dehydrogenase